MTTCATIEECRKAAETLAASLTSVSGVYAGIALAGAASMGFVIGWTLYFANRGRSGAISATELVAMAGVVGGGAVLSWVDKSGVLGPGLFGAFGIGLLAGFLAYLIMLRRTRPDNGPAIELEAMVTTAARPSFRSFGRFEAESAEAPQAREIVDELKRSRDQVEALLREVGIALDLGGLSGSDKAALEAAAGRLRTLRDELNDKIIAISFGSAEVSALLAALEAETKALNDEADRMKRITKQIGKVNGALASLTGLIEKLKSLA